MYDLATYRNYVTVTLCFVLSIRCILFYIRIILQMLFLSIKCILFYIRIILQMLFLQWHIFHGFRIRVFLGYVCIPYENNVTITFRFRSSLWRIFITLQWSYFFVQCSCIFYDVRITLYFGTFKLRIEISLQLRFFFARNCEVCFIAWQLPYLFVRCCYVFWWR